jgi:hypothetical protein
MLIPCGGCLGCREAKAKAWALRCKLELNEHPSAAFTTLTYDNRHVPPTLRKEHLQRFLKRLRRRLERSEPARTIRFFACGEYGETTQRPHYHAILYNTSKKDADAIQASWPYGHTHTVEATPQAISYVAGYAAKKLGEDRQAQEERVDPETGEVYNHQPPFIQMSRRPGIGGNAKQKYATSWRACAVLNGQTQSVPRYLHEGWQQQATPLQMEQLQNEKKEKMKQIVQTSMQRTAAEQIAIKKQELKAARRTKL